MGREHLAGPPVAPLARLYKPARRSSLSSFPRSLAFSRTLLFAFSHISVALPQPATNWKVWRYQEAFDMLYSPGKILAEYCIAGGSRWAPL